MTATIAGVLFDVRSHRDEGVEVVSVVGDVDLASLPQLASRLASLDGPVRLELGSVDFFDPVCLGVLVAADLRARRHGSALEVVVSRRLGELLAETRLDEVLAVRPADS
ncbi:MAG: STAS domain-containing protein [Microthrixaceae bacterium]|nr:STAS domain-containing protein [Microthrixaceae bacterium]